VFLIHYAYIIVSLTKNLTAKRCYVPLAGSQVVTIPAMERIPGTVAQLVRCCGTRRRRFQRGFLAGTVRFNPARTVHAPPLPAPRLTAADDLLEGSSACRRSLIRDHRASRTCTPLTMSCRPPSDSVYYTSHFSSCEILLFSNVTGSVFRHEQCVTPKSLSNKIFLTRRTHFLFSMVELARYFPDFICNSRHDFGPSNFILDVTVHLQDISVATSGSAQVCASFGYSLIVACSRSLQCISFGI